jgi:hypothetical protein
MTQARVLGNGLVSFFFLKVNRGDSVGISPDHALDVDISKLALLKDCGHVSAKASLII